MSRQHAAPILVPADGPAAPLAPAQTGWSEAVIQRLIQDHPGCLPIREIDPLFADPVPLCTEMNTPAGPVDNVFVTASGLPVLAECKLWSNPQSRREVVGQILDYAKELSRWTASDFQREVSRRTGRTGNAVLELVREAGHTVDEVAFTDALTLNLRRGRFLLLIVGDGIREGVEAIAEYLQAHAGLHFTLGLVELPVFALPDGSRLVAPRVLAKTNLVTRTVVAVPEDQTVLDDAAATEVDEPLDPVSREAFWGDFVRDLVLDDPEQTKPRPGRQGYVTSSLPVPGGHAWLVSYRSEPQWRVGVYLSHSRDGIGAKVNERLLEDAPAILAELGGGAHIDPQRDGRRLLLDFTQTGPWSVPAEREKALAWLCSRTNDFVNALRPRIKAAVAELTGGP